MYRWIDSKGETTQTKTIKEFAALTGMRESNARSLACGYLQTFRGWCSTHKRAAKRRKRFTTVLVNSRTGEKHMVGQRVTDFAKKHGLALNDTYQLLNARILCLKGWMLQSTYKAMGLCPGVDS